MTDERPAAAVCIGPLVFLCSTLFLLFSSNLKFFFSFVFSFVRIQLAGSRLLVVSLGRVWLRGLGRDLGLVLGSWILGFGFGFLGFGFWVCVYLVLGSRFVQLMVVFSPRSIHTSQPDPQALLPKLN